MSDLISIIIPVYNVLEFLDKCLSSVLLQTYTDLEIILIDDGSTDGSSKLCDEYAKKDQRIKVIHKNNSGQSSARNYGIDICTGKYVAFIDADDFVSKDYIEYLYNLIIKYNADISNCRFKKIWDYDNRIGGSEKTVVKKFNSQEAIESMCYLRELNCAAYGKLFKREILSEIRFPVGIIYEDLATIYKIFDRADVLVYGSEFKYFYFQRRGSSLNSNFNTLKLSRVPISDEIYAFIEKKYPIILKSAACRKFWSNAGALMDLPWERKYKNYMCSIRKNIQACRCIVLFDNKVKVSIRIMAACSFLGIVPLKLLGSLYRIFIKK